MSCICKYKYNVICGLCKLPFKEATTKEQRISELKRIIAQNRVDNLCHKIEIRDLQNEMDIDDDVDINRVIK